MTKPGRLSCVNPHCNRTAPVEREGEEADMICRKCWSLLPADMRRRYQQLKARQKLIFKLIERRLARGNISRSTVELIERQFSGRCEANWRGIRDYFVTGEKPLGLEGFLQEMRL